MSATAMLGQVPFDDQGPTPDQQGAFVQQIRGTLEVSHRVAVAMTIVDKLHTPFLASVQPVIGDGQEAEWSVMRLQCEDDLLESACQFLQDYLRIRLPKEHEASDA